MKSLQLLSVVTRLPFTFVELLTNKMFAIGLIKTQGKFTRDLSIPLKLLYSVECVEWLAHSLNLSISDFFLWGHLKKKVLKHRPHTLEDFKERTREEVTVIPIRMCRPAVENYRILLQKYIAADSRHLKDVIFKT